MREELIKREELLGREAISGPELPKEECKPSIKDLERANRLTLQENHIQIEFQSIGCVVRVGCKSFAFDSVPNAMDAINKYVNDPRNQKRVWLDKLGGY